MAGESTVPAAEDIGTEPGVRMIGAADLRQALARGVHDFAARPGHLAFLGVLYALVCLGASRIVIGYAMIPLLFPLLAGVALIGPLTAIGLYEISRRRERGEEISWRHAFAVLRSPSIGAIVGLGAVLLVIFLAWIFAATSIYVALFGSLDMVTPGRFARRVFTTPSGWTLMFLGNAVGLLFALSVLAIGSVSFPMLVDRPVGVAMAVRTSVRAVAANPQAMLTWGLIVVGLLALGILSFFVGLAVIVPVLGHATWHLYRMLVEPD